MPMHSIYRTPARDFTPAEFVEEYNKHDSRPAAVAAMGIPSPRMSVICSRLRKRGYPVRLFSGGIAR